MDIRGMHYDFKLKFNKLDSQKNRNLLIPEIDWFLNEAQDVFIKAIAEPRYVKGLGFELNQRSIDDIKPIVTKQFFKNGTGNCLIPQVVDSKTYRVSLPEDYRYFTSARAIASKGGCLKQELKVFLAQDDDFSQETSFTKPSFEWREVNIYFSSDGILIKTDGTFAIDALCINYLKRPKRMHNARDTQSQQYYLPNKVTLLTGFQDCELPEAVHSEIVDIAVLIATMGMLPDYQIKQAKTQLTD